MSIRQRILRTLVLFIFVSAVVVCGMSVSKLQTEEIPSWFDPDSCPSSYDEHPLILISMDGFKPDYLKRGLTPTLNAIRDAGVKTDYMKPTYPSLTFPNHYSAVTGLYPESHGIIANQFFDPEFNAQFKMGNNESLHGRWWGGEPIWNTLTRHEKLSATLFWPGSEADIQGLHPTYWYNYTDDMAFSDRVDTVLEWIQLPKETRPSWISLYFNEPDHTAHGEGPDSTQVNEKIVEVDYAIKTLMIGLRDLQLTSCVNLIFTSDHGGATSSNNTIVHIDKWVPDLYDQAFFYGGAFSRIDPRNKSEEVSNDIIERITCQNEHLRLYKRRDLPKRMHFSNNRRIEDIVLDLDPGYTANLNSNWTLKGNHGYDNYFSSMDAVFFAYGPDFKLEYTIPPFQNIQLYEFMCRFLDIEPAPNNGTKGALYDITNKQMPDIPGPEGETPERTTFPSDPESRLNVSRCSGNITDIEGWEEQFNFEEDQMNNLEHLHNPFGIPLKKNLSYTDIILLHQSEFVTGFSPILKMPLWISSTVLHDIGSNEPLDHWYSDVRLDEGTSPTCDFYNNLASQNITMHSLYPNKFFYSGTHLEERAAVVSNAIPITNQAMPRFTAFTESVIGSWFQSYSDHGFHLLMGPVFDWNYDSLPDDLETIKNNSMIPSDIFFITTRCKNGTESSLENCPESDLDVRSFMLPQAYFEPSICGPLEDNLLPMMLQYSCRIQDIETVTGLTLFHENLTPQSQIELKTKISPTIWNVVF